tara:strand:- start:54 stop:533 length:480 start_codon:yes stop_codon:yes gene_type:complete
MAVNLNIKTNSKEISAKFKKFGSVLPRIIDKGVKQAGFQLVDRIKTKTKRGVDFEDKPFAPYTKGYIKRLEREDRPTAVDLFYDGRMTGALTPSMVKKTGKHQVTLAFSRKEEIDKAFFNQTQMGEKNRVFFKFDDKTEKIINKSFNKFIEKELKKIRL